MRALTISAALLLLGCSVSLEFDGLAGARGEQPLEPGSVGSGIAPAWEQLPITEIVDGFVVGRELVAAVRVHGNSHDGALLAVDLDSGARRLVAGALTDVDGMPWDVGSGPWLDDLRAARVLADGSWAVLLWDGSELGGEVLTVDPVDGDRTTRHSLGASCEGVDVYASGAAPALGESGEIWLPYWASGPDGVLRIDQASCERIEIAVGSASVLADAGDALLFVDGDTGSLGSIDHATHDVGWVSGSGAAGARGLAVLADDAFTIGAEPEPVYARWALGSGERTPLEVTGPARAAAQYAPNLWRDGARLVVELDGAIALIELDTGESRILSY
jgi:hypothetical protein